MTSFRERLLALWDEACELPEIAKDAVWCGSTKDLLCRLGMEWNEKANDYCFVGCVQLDGKLTKTEGVPTLDFDRKRLLSAQATDLRADLDGRYRFLQDEVERLKFELRGQDEEISGLEAALKVAREKGEHYPICGTPPREVMNDREAHRNWTEAKYVAWSTPEGKADWWAEHCICWKAEMEKVLVMVYPAGVRP